MKKQYIAPCFEAIEIKPARMMALSVGEDVDGEARSQQFSGSSMFDEKENDSDSKLWY